MDCCQKESHDSKTDKEAQKKNEQKGSITTILLIVIVGLVIFTLFKV